MTTQASQTHSDPRHFVADVACNKCGTSIRSIKTRACIECDRIRHRKPIHESAQIRPLTAKQHIVDTACKKCGTFVRNKNTGHCIECDRIRQRNAYAAKHAKHKPMPQPVPAPIPCPAPVPKPTIKPVMTKPPKPSVEAHAINSALFAKPIPVEKGGVLKQPATAADRYLVSERLAADVAAFMAKRGAA